MKFVFFGDSITDAGRNRENDFWSNSYGWGYVRDVTSVILSDNPQENLVYNRGIGGERIVDLYARVKKDVWNLKPDVLTILEGVNDIWAEVGSQNGVELDRFEKFYDMLIKETIERLPDVKIIIMEPFALKGSATEENWDKFSKITEYAKVVKSIAQKYNIPFIPLQKDLEKAVEEKGVTSYFDDGVHPNIAGSRLIADKWLDYYKKNIK